MVHFSLMAKGAWSLHKHADPQVFEPENAEELFLSVNVSIIAVTAS